MRTPEEKWGKGQTTKPAYRQAQAELSRQARASLDRIATQGSPLLSSLARRAAQEALDPIPDTLKTENKDEHRTRQSITR